MGEFLCIGDYISLFCEETEGYVYSYQTSSSHNGLYIYQGQDRKKPGKIPNPHAITFRVCIQNRYKLNKKYRKLLAASSKDPENLELKALVAQAKTSANAENQDNISEQKRQHGKRVRYGEIIQLKHVFTDKYVHISTTQTSHRDKNNMLISLHQYNGKHAQFRILPRYKVKSEGEYVQILDQIVYESFKSQGHYFHSSVPWNIEKDMVGSELNLGVAQTGFTVVRYYRPSDENEANVRGSSFIRLFHKELEAYLVAEGLFGEPVQEEVHLRIREIDQLNPRTLSPPNSAITYWQVEPEDTILNGGVVRWEQQVRLRHVTTRRFLCLDADFEVCLTAEENDPRSVFRFHPVLSLSDFEQNEIDFESYCRIEHVLTGNWLHALKDEPYQRRRDMGRENDRSMQALRWDGGEVRKISSTENRRYVDVFTIHEVEWEQIYSANFVAGMVPFLSKLIESREECDYLNAMKTHQITTALQELKQFMIINGETYKDHQKLMRNFRIVDLLVQLLQSPLQDAPDSNYLLSVFKEAYDILYTYMTGNSRKNALYFAKYIEFFQTQLSLKASTSVMIKQYHLVVVDPTLKGDIGLNVAQMLVELIRDNRQIVDRITHEQIDIFVDLLRQRKNYRFLDLLNVLCVCDGKTILENQSYITETWLRHDKVSFDAKTCHIHLTGADVYLIERGQYIHKEHNVVYISTDAGHTWVPLHQFANADSPYYSEEEYLYLDRQLDLLGKLCKGRNQFSIRVITKDLDILTWENTFVCLRSELLPPSLRAKYCSLIIDLFVDVGASHSVLDQHTLVFVYEDIDNPRPLYSTKSQVATNVLFLAQELGTVFPVMRDWIQEFVESNPEMYSSQVGQNKLIEQVMRLLCYLVRFGCYCSADEIRILLKPLMIMLDGRNDRPFPKNAEIQNSKEVKKLVKQYRETDRFEKSAETKALVDAKYQGLSVLELLFTFQSNTRLESFVSKFKTAETTANAKKKKHRSVLSPLVDDSYDAFNTSKKNLRKQKKFLHELRAMFESSSYFDVEYITNISLDLSNYKYEKMLTQSLNILNKYYSSKTDMFKIAIPTLVLTTQESCKIHIDIMRQLPLVRHLAKCSYNMEQAEAMSVVFDQFVLFTHLRDEPTLRHPMNQKILINHGVLDLIFAILSQEVDVQITEQAAPMELVFGKALNLLRFLAQGNEDVQAKMNDRLDSLMNIKLVPSHLAIALREVFAGNQNNCLKIQPKQILKIVHLAGENQDRAPEFLDLLGSIVKVELLELPLKRNQGLVMKYLMQNYHKAAYLFDQSQEDRLRILTSKTGNSHQRYLISLVDLLAKCAEGENRYIESLCQTIMPIEEIMDVLNNHFIDNNLKSPYLRYLMWVYMKTAGTMIESGAGDLPHDRHVWIYIQALAREAESLKTYISENEVKTVEVMRAPPPKGAVAEMDDSDGAAHATLFYFFDAVLPFLQTFFTKFYSPDKELYPDELEYVDQLAHSLVLWCDRVGAVLCNATHLKVLIGCVPSVLQSSSIPKNLSTESALTNYPSLKPKQVQLWKNTYKVMEGFIEQYGNGRCLRDPTRETIDTYTIYYQNEDELNKKFRAFSVNCSLVYGGHNTVTAQLKHKSKREYTEIGGDEDLPLGEEFQAHVRCFVKHNEKNIAKRYQNVSKLVQQLAVSANAVNPKDGTYENDELDIKSLQILRAVIHNEERKLREDWEENTQDKKVQKQLKVILEVQNTLNSYSAVEEVLPHLGRPSNAIVRESLAFLSIMLFNANRNVQRTMLDVFKSMRTETFFFAIRIRLEIAANGLKERRALATQHEARVKESMTQAKSLQTNLTVGRKAMKDIQAIERSRRQSRLMKGARANSLRALQRDRQSGLTSISPASSKCNSLQRFKLPNGSLNEETPLVFGSNHNDIELNEVMVEGSDNLSVDVEEDDVLDGLEFKDEGYIVLVLRLLAAMCDGQNQSIQDYLRDQPDNIKSINVVADTAQFVNVVYSNITASTIDLVIQLFSTLNEFTAGNQANRVVLLDNKVVDYINFILRAGKYEGISMEMQLELREVIANLLVSLIEENGPEPIKVAREVKDTVDKEAVYRCMVDCYSIHQPPTYKAKISTNMGDNMKNLSQMGGGLLREIMEKNKKNDLKDKAYEVGFLYFLLMARFYDIDPVLNEKAGLVITPDQMAAYNYYKKNSMSIELMKDGNLQKVHFRVKNKNVLREEVKEKLKWDVDRSSPSNKIRDLMAWSKDILKDIYYQRKMLRNPIAVFFTKFWLLWNYLVILLSVAINVLMLWAWKAPYDMSQAPENMTHLDHAIYNPNPDTSSVEIYDLLLYAMGGTHNLFSLFVLISYFLSNHPKCPSLSAIPNLCRRLCGRKDEEEDEIAHEVDCEKAKRQSKLDVKFFSLATFYYVIFVGMSVAGTFFHGYFFAFHLLNIVNNNQILQGVIKAVTQNGVSLLWVGILGVIIFYIYALISFAFMRALFLPKDEEYCGTLLECSVTVIRYGLIGAIFDRLTLPESENNFIAFAVVAVFHLSFFILITTIGLNVILGIVVDTFSELRDLKWTAESDMRDTCFICSRGSHDFEHHGNGFLKHAREEHNMWAYIFFFIHLDDTKSNDYTALDLHVAQALQREQYEFFPMNCALSLTGEEDGTDEKIDAVLEKVTELLRRQREEESKRMREEEHRRQKQWQEMYRKALSGSHDTLAAAIEGPRRPEDREGDAARYSDDDDSRGGVRTPETITLRDSATSTEESPPRESPRRTEEPPETPRELLPPPPPPPSDGPHDVPPERPHDEPHALDMAPHVSEVAFPLTAPEDFPSPTFSDDDDFDDTRL
ncbi:inositol 1,4,5-trisphosphate receptor type 3 isoform X4 [Lingula anatina]|uniref:Inositol 1,4,5-trisphosphate receptor n=2 Tax=Lingula anatina TaxID=7574 RepID=A0A1S3H6H0_LINAN|nr:inositol 1,4,5-trisphosphate receptor type 3 isoform X4 [Lingula anatina]|eukprot:XP_013381715.1 inositol 1,4,5-trisphosphate receptor type 3 isoform X4 [Lingula anatina]